ncbi:MAG: serine hydrolase domain-containing protein [Pseudomonadota bacterium]
MAAGIAVAVDRTFFSVETRTCSAHATRSSRPDLQRILNGLVTGRSALAPGATAYVSGPHGSWLGAAGVADTSTCARMPVNARMRLESVTKIYTATLILQLAQAGTLRVDDTVERWLPGLLPSYGNRITIRQLLTMTSGLIDNNDFMNASDSVRRTYLAHVKDAELRAQMLATIARANEDPAVVVSELLWIRWAAWQPLLFTPGSGYSHYSNIGYDILGLIAARAGGKPLAALYREQIFEPLGLHATAYDPQGPISGPHARGYGIDDGARFDTTDWHWGVGAEGGIVANARDTGAFLTARMRGKLLDRAQLTAMELENLWRGGESSGCDGQAYGWSGGGAGYKTDVWVNDGGSRVAVLLVNARHHGPPQVLADAAVHHALASLYCSA